MPYNKLLTNRACSGRTREYWPSVVFVRTSLRSVRTVTTSGQYSPVRPSRSVSKRLIFYIKKIGFKAQSLWGRALIKFNQMQVFEERGKPEYPGKNLPEQRREEKRTNKFYSHNHIWRRVWKSNPGHVRERRVLSPQRYHCSLGTSTRKFLIQTITIATPKALLKTVLKITIFDLPLG